VDAEHAYYVGAGGVLVHNAYHHYWPKWLGSEVRYGNTSILTWLNDPDHTALHTALHDFLRNNYPHLLYGPGNPGRNIRAFSRLT
jgi:hypothetical protein